MASIEGIRGDVSTETQAGVMRWSDYEESGIMARSGRAHGAEGVWGEGDGSRPVEGSGSYYPQETLGEGRIEGR
jgi:hypothetical protein